MLLGRNLTQYIGKAQRDQASSFGLPVLVVDLLTYQLLFSADTRKKVIQARDQLIQQSKALANGTINPERDDTDLSEYHFLG